MNDRYEHIHFDMNDQYEHIHMAIATAPFTTMEDDIKAEIEQRLPRLKRKKYTIKIL